MSQDGLQAQGEGGIFADKPGNANAANAGSAGVIVHMPLYALLIEVEHISARGGGHGSVVEQNKVVYHRPPQGEEEQQQLRTCDVCHEPLVLLCLHQANRMHVDVSDQVGLDGHQG
eukprot:CAMPEP_0173211856 /NCGR_PEP_ID=MMETSP1141-20130122/24471_1 /TAXON_ID=483371 /ORGANISM="non described non described, Strain CCMP2298" /LENGTH=115 /DNA_ID=CAMNT_0014138799 /DNA_START=785 /DNA_END=1133 /DNA_ORIENTATION=-